MAFQRNNLVFESHPGYASGTYVSEDGTETASVAQFFGIQAQHTKETFKHDLRIGDPRGSPVIDFEEIPIDAALAVEIENKMQALSGGFQGIDFSSLEGIETTLSPAAQKGGGGTFTCVGFVEFAAEQAGHNSGQGFVRNVFESFAYLDPNVFPPVLRTAPLLSPQLLNYALSPAQLAVPQQVALLMPPAPTANSRLDLRGESDQAGTFTFQTGDAAPIDIEAAPGSTFNPIAWARSLTQMTLSSMLSPLRASRLQMQVVEDPSLPTLSDVIERLLSDIWHATATDDPTDRRFQRLVRRALLEQLIDLVAGDAATPAARETTLGHLSLLRQSLTPEVAGDPAEVGMIIEAMRDLDRVLSCGSEGCDEDAP